MEWMLLLLVFLFLIALFCLAGYRRWVNWPFWLILTGSLFWIGTETEKAVQRWDEVHTLMPLASLWKADIAAGMNSSETKAWKFALEKVNEKVNGERQKLNFTAEEVKKHFQEIEEEFRKELAQAQKDGNVKEVMNWTFMNDQIMDLILNEPDTYIRRLWMFVMGYGVLPIWFLFELFLLLCWRISWRCSPFGKKTESDSQNDGPADDSAMAS